MNKKNTIIIISTTAVVIAASALIYSYIAPPSKGTGITVEVPHPVTPTFNQAQLDILKNKVVDYSQNISPAATSSSPNNSNSFNSKQSLRNMLR